MRRTRSRYRLTGGDQAQPLVFRLEAGENSIGSFPGNRVVLRDQAISRRHATITIDPVSFRITVRDDGSLNGTFVNGQQVKQSPLRVGDRVRFGGSVFMLEEVDADDVELGVRLETGAPREFLQQRQPEHSTELTAVGRDIEGLARWQEPFESFVSETVRRNPLQGRALGVLLQGLGVDGGCFLNGPVGQDPVVAASWGEYRPILKHPAVRDRMAHHNAEKENPSVFLFQGERSGACVSGRSPTGAPSYLLINGNIPAGREATRLLRSAFLLLRGIGGSFDSEGSETGMMTQGLSFPDGYVECRSAGMQTVYQQLKTAVASRLPVLLVGETGVGKEPLARVVHLSSPRRNRSFVAINCAAIPAELLEAELFGILSGVATGVSARKGKVLEADGGTLFLDEIAEMPPAHQTKLLRMLQERKVQPVGEREPVPVDVVIVAATNRPVSKLIGDGGLRPDLYFRLAGCLVEIPSLRTRRDDIPLLLEHFIRRECRAQGRSVRGVTVRALEILSSHDWPGNVRELEHDVRRMVSLCPFGQAIHEALVGPHIAQRAVDREDTGDGIAQTLEEKLAAVERRLIRNVLTMVEGNKSAAARRLGISRNGLARRMKRLSLEES